MSDTANCLNCGAMMTGPYCSSCGQKQVQQDLTLSEFLSETTQELTHWEGKVPTTLKVLFLQPGRLTQEFLAGRRARWLPPLRLYLICSLVYFVGDALGEGITHRSERELAKMTVTGADGRVSLTPEGRQQVAKLPVAKLVGMERVEHAVVNNAKFNQTIESALPKAMFVLLPLFAFMTLIAWRRTMPRYPAHLYLALHLHAAWFAALALMSILTMFVTSIGVLTVAGFVMLAYIVWYGLMAARRVFAESWARTIAKAAAVIVAYGVVLNGVTTIILGYAIVSS